MTSGVGWVEDYHDPDSPASRMIGRWRQGPGGIARVAARDIPGGDPPGTPLRVLQPRLDGPRLGTRTCDRPGVRRRPWRSCGGLSARSNPAVVGLDGPAQAGGVAMAAAALAVDRAGLGAHRHGSRWTAAGTATAWSTAPGSQASSRPEQPFLAARPAAQHDHHACRLRLPLVAARPRRRPRDGRRDARSVRLRRSAPPYRRRQDVGVAVRGRRGGTGSAATCATSRCPRSRKPPRARR